MQKCFIDTNVVVYANDCNAAEKQSVAVHLITALMQRRNGYVSIQVLQEYANTALGKLNQEPSIVLRQLKLLESLSVIVPSPKTVRRAVEVRNAYQIAFWDAAIVAAAESADCDVILSEDLNTGQYYARVEVVDPFVSGIDLSALVE